MDFELVHTDECTHARAGVITTDHGKIQTPIFMPVGTVASVKAVHQRELRDDIKAQIILGEYLSSVFTSGIGYITSGRWTAPV